MPRLAVLFGARRLTVFALLQSVAVLVLFPLAPSVIWWLPLRLALGIAAEILSLGMVAGPTVLSAVGIGHQALT